MDGTLLKNIARRIKNEGRTEGQEENGMKVFLNLIGTGMSREAVQRLTEIEYRLVKKALRLRKP